MEVPSGGPDRVVRLEVGPEGHGGNRAPAGIVDQRPAGDGATVHPAYPHKTTAREAFLKAREEASQAGADDALLLTAQRHGRRVRDLEPVLVGGRPGGGAADGAGGAPGVARMRIEELRGPVVEQTLTRAQLEGRALFVANAVRGVVPVVELDGRNGAGVAVLRRLGGAVLALTKPKLRLLLAARQGTGSPLHGGCSSIG